MDFDRIVADNEKAVFKYLKRIVRDHQLAEDLCQEAFLRALQRLRRGDPIPQPRPWLLCVARNLAFDASRRRDSTVVDSEKLEGLAAAPSEASFAELLIGSPANAPEGLGKLIQESLTQLSVADREAIARRYDEGMDYWEIALRSGVTAQSAKMKLFRGRKKLRRFIRLRVRHPQAFVATQAG